jgi:hypothetical protein
VSGGSAEAAARAHAARLVARDGAARRDLAPGALLDPPEVIERLLAGPFDAFELVAHARIGAHHVFKTKLIGPTTLVVQARWAEDGGTWRIREIEIARVLARDPGPGA